MQAVAGVRLPEGLVRRLDRFGDRCGLRVACLARLGRLPLLLAGLALPSPDAAAEASSWTARIASWMSCSDMCAYQTSSVRMPANSAIAEPVRLHRLQRHRPGVLRGEAVVAGGDGEAGRHPLQVVLERTRQRLVEVVQTEQQLPLRRGEPAEVGQMRVPTQLHRQARRRCAGQVGRHHLRRPPVERERRHHHPAVPHRHQIRLAGGVLRDQQLHRIRPVSRRLPLRVRRHRRPLRRLLPTGPAIINADVRRLSLSGHEYSIRVSVCPSGQSRPRLSRSVRDLTGAPWRPSCRCHCRR